MSVRKIEMKQEPITVSDTRKFDVSVMPFFYRYFAAQCFKDLYSKERQKTNNTRCTKNIACKNFDLSKRPTLVNTMSKELQICLISGVLY